MIGAAAAVGRMVDGRDDHVHRLTGDREVGGAMRVGLLDHGKDLLRQLLAGLPKLRVVVKRHLVIRARADQLGREIEFMGWRLLTPLREHMCKGSSSRMRFSAEMRWK